MLPEKKSFKNAARPPRFFCQFYELFFCFSSAPATARPVRVSDF